MVPEQEMPPELRELLEQVDYASERFLMCTRPDATSQTFERELVSVLRPIARVLEYEIGVRAGTPHAVDPMFYEMYCGHVRVPSGNVAIGHVAADRHQRLIFFVTKDVPPLIACRTHNQFYVPGSDPRIVTLHQLTLIGVKPYEMLSVFRQRIHEILVSDMVTAPGGDA